MSDNVSRKEAAKKIAAERLARDPDYYKKLAQRVRRRGRSTSTPAGFAADPEMARVAGAKGGQATARAKKEAAAGEEKAALPGDAVQTGESSR